MSLRKIFIGGNWKCNNTFEQSKQLLTNVINKLSYNSEKIDVSIAPIYLHIPYVLQNVQKNILVTTQNLSLTGMGAFTGEISAEHAKDMNIPWTILGHSERRQFYNESSEIVGKKVKAALKQDIKVIACIGEKLEQREANQTFNVVQTQLDAIKSQLSEQDWQNIVIAYEPVWAIGTGKVATPDQAQEVHNFIRTYLNKNITKNVSQNTRIIYGGSVTDKNSKDLIALPDVDGFLIGGASLKIDFLNIVHSCN